MKKFWSGLIAVVAMAAGAAQAADDSLIYASVGVGGVDGSQEAYRRDGNQLSVGYSFGYRFNANVGAEIYTRSLSFRLSGPRRDFAYPDTHSGVAAVYRYPVAQMFSLNGRVGVGQTRMSRDDGGHAAEKTSVTAGVGAALELGRRVALTAGYERYSGIDAGLWLVSWQLGY
ncbi:outer membrane beta-barrel protein [Roseateles chitinivorans]|uniref:outer membrane beta-barrel protein n=1 Tax=Roseateles chitinivorans TaxID=2917965 RepID=UPI003D66D6C3